jgi:hypothetical protein
MKDDFIKSHRQPPDPQFVEQLYQKINAYPTQSRSYPMLKRTLRFALLSTLALLLVAAVTLTVSPAARAAVQSIFSFNGVDVSVDDSTGKLVTSGNTDAILQQTDHSVVIQGKNGEIAGMAIASASQQVDVSQLLSQYPDLPLPNVPAGYSLQPQGQLFDDGSLTITWTDTAGNTITFQRTKPVSFQVGADGTAGEPPDSGQTSVGSITVASPPTGTIDEGGLTVSGEGQVITSTMSASSGVQASPFPAYTWEKGEYTYMLTTTDASLTQADLQAMLP